MLLGKIWFNGKIVDYADAGVPLLTHSLHYGSCAFEGIRAYETEGGPAIFRLDEHMERLMFSAESLYMDVPYAKDEIAEACKAVIRDNGFKSAYIRPIIFYGDESCGVDPVNNKVHVAIIAWPWDKFLHDDSRVMISKFHRISPDAFVAHAKVGGHYVNSIHATREAKLAGYDEALLLDAKGNIAEAPGANIFFIKDKTLVTPASRCILQGITRKTILEIAPELGFGVEERSIGTDELAGFESAFFTGTAAEVTPIASIDAYAFSTEQVKDIQGLYLALATGKKESKYLTRI